MKFTDNDGKITLVEWLSIVYYIFLLSFFLRWRKDREIYHHVMLLGFFLFCRQPVLLCFLRITND